MTESKNEVEAARLSRKIDGLLIQIQAQTPAERLQAVNELDALQIRTPVINRALKFASLADPDPAVRDAAHVALNRQSYAEGELEAEPNSARRDLAERIVGAIVCFLVNGLFAALFFGGNSSVQMLLGPLAFVFNILGILYLAWKRRQVAFGILIAFGATLGIVAVAGICMSLTCFDLRNL